MLWGYKDGVTITGTVQATNGSATLTGTGTQFLSQVKPGWVLNFPLSSGTGSFVVKSVQSNTSLTLTENVTNAAAGQVSAKVIEMPRFKYLKDSVKKNNVFGVDVAEAKLKGIHPGWVLKRTVGSRVKYETLVATRNITGDFENTEFPNS